MKGGISQIAFAMTIFTSLLVFVLGVSTLDAYITNNDQGSVDGHIQTCSDQNEVKGSCTTVDARNRTGLVEDMIPIENNFECGIYLAPSSIPNAGFGIFTTRSIKKDGMIQPYSESPSIVVTDFYDPAGNEEQDWNHVDYIWEPVGFTAFEAEESSVSVMTFGSLCNYHPVLKNVSPDNSEYDDTLLNRFEDPGAGAISYHNGNIFRATREISAGEELFADYGSDWLEHREGSFADGVPRADDYGMVANVMSRLNRGTENHFQSEKELTVLRDVISVFSERVANAFPKTISKFEDIVKDTIELGNKNKRNKGVVSKAQLKRVVAKNSLVSHSVDWIKTNGICMEKIRPGPSTIAGAGRGAFAQLPIKAGEVIAPAPLLNIAQKVSLLTYETKGDREKDISNGQQLLTNYCFGHKDVDLILCPQTNGILINHCSSRDTAHQCNDGKGPNAIARWAGAWDPTTAQWLEKSVDEIRRLTASGMRGLSLEFVATRDITPGEEVFIDYGIGWEDAWSSHLNTWTPPISNDDHYPLLSMNIDEDIRTIDELETNPYPTNMQLYCYGGRIVDKELDEEEKRIGVVDGSNGFRGSMDEFDDLLPCSIEEIDRHERKHVVGMKYEGMEYFVQDFPVKSITLRMKKYSSDQFLKNTFRHYIEIRDEIIPSQWLEKEE